ncbi:MAG: M28 family peptidase [Anaerolineales bacterium]
MIQNCNKYLKKLCLEIPERSVGSEGNREATRFFRETAASFGWEVESTEFNALDWEETGAELSIENQFYQVFPSPYSHGVEIQAELLTASTLQELEGLDCTNKLLLLSGELCREQLMPKNFVFYNPERHQQIISLLEEKKPSAILCSTSRNAALAGGVYPFPLIEDGDFEIPSVYLTEEEGIKLISQRGKEALLCSRARRIPGLGYNVVARKGNHPDRRVVITAHIDAKKGTPGAIDNGTGVIILLLLAEYLRDYSGDTTLELVAFNGEDYFAASGQMVYLEQNRDRFDEMILNINIDGAGYHQGLSAFSFFEVKEEVKSRMLDVLKTFAGITEGAQWVQGDHSIFIQQGIPAIAVSSKWFIDHIDQQEITHTPKDNPGIVDCHKVVEIAEAIQQLILKDEI